MTPTPDVPAKPVASGTPDDELPKFFAKVDATGDCWLWTGHVRHDGYGQVKHGGRTAAAHRLVYGHLVEPVPAGLQLDHLCRNRQCVNPDHLEPVTSRENTLRGVNHVRFNAAKTHCPEGHAYDVVNTYVDKDGRRHCRTCHRARVAARKLKARQRRIAQARAERDAPSLMLRAMARRLVEQRREWRLRVETLTRSHPELTAAPLDVIEIPNDKLCDGCQARNNRVAELRRELATLMEAIEECANANNGQGWRA